MSNKITSFKFKPFSDKQLKVLTWWLPNSPYCDYDMIIADGAVRSGKTISMSLSYIMWATDTFDQENLGMAGKTIGSFRRNVLNPLKRMLKAMKYRVKEHRAENMFEVRKGRKVNYFYIFGGKDERSQDLIQGITLAGMFFDEVALMPESFVNQATARCSIEGSKLWFNCNPAGPYHWFKVNYIDMIADKIGLHLHFTMDDNLSLSKKIKERYHRMYTGVFFDRYIRGLWVMAEGIIYDMFSEKVHVGDYANTTYSKYAVSVDYGTANPCTFGLFGIDGNTSYMVRQYWYDSAKKGKQKTDSEYADDFEEWIGDIKPAIIYVDPSAASFIAELRKRGYKVVTAKNDVLTGIRFVSTCLSTGRFFVDRLCVAAIKEFVSYVWNVKAQEVGEDEPLKQNDHAMDMIRYFLFTYYTRFQAVSART
ncbi:PBSX family phage terminase large subunit [Pelosinus sp. sgz500959]|uniref:PBSX family phage terminase large subunit n=1 Tax=Pelosinus sp. sgz500959 TaxID=3242472 RepID=UPI00366C1B6D